MSKNKTAPIPAPGIKTENRFLIRFENQVIWQYFMLAVIPFFIYIKTVGFEFINLDDTAIIRANFDIIAHIKNIWIAFKTDAFLSAHGDYYRPMQTVSFMVDAMIGGERTWIYHLSNLIYHLFTVIALYNLLRLLNIKNLVAFSFALLFAIHPLLTSSVSWVPARGDVLIGLFSVLLFISFIRYLDTRSTGWLVLHALFFLLAVFSKETAIIFPAVLLLYYFVVRAPKQPLKTLAPFMIIWIIPAALFLFLRSKVVIQTPPDFIFGIAPFLKNLPFIPIVVAKFFAPLNLSTMPLFEPVFTFAGSCILIVLTILVIRYTAKKKTTALLGFAWFLLFLIPPMFFKLFYSNFLVEYYEHRTYLPVVGLIIMLAYILNDYITTTSSKNPVWIVAAAIIIFIPFASAHSDDFKNSITFFGRAADLGNPGAATKRGEEYMRIRDYDHAKTDFENAVDLSEGQYPLAFYNRGLLKSVGKDHASAEEDMTKAISLDTSLIEGYIDRANERILNSNFQGAYNDLMHARQFDTNNTRVYYTLGKVFVNTQQFNSADSAFTKSLTLDSSQSEAFNDRAYARYKLKDYNGALNDCNRALKLSPQFLNAFYNKGIIYFETGKYDLSIKTLDTTLMLANNFYFGYFYRGMAKMKKNDIKGACADWQESVNLGFTMAQDTIKKYCK
jgi:tetratricopeptide (TPR) repeat protein